jgi:hypothetical protein
LNIAVVALAVEHPFNREDRSEITLQIDASMDWVGQSLAMHRPVV